MTIRIKAITSISIMMFLSASVFTQAGTYTQIRVSNTEERILDSESRKRNIQKDKSLF